MKDVSKNWEDFFKEVSKKDYCSSLHDFLDSEYSSFVCYPPRKLLFNAFNLTPLQNVKVVIIGQDPYHEPNQAMGLCFSVSKNVAVPPSLINIYKEIELEYNVIINKNNGDLTYLAKQGVLLLNAILSVREHQPMSHNREEYFEFLKDVLTTLDRQTFPIVFMLWGGPARKLKEFLHNPTHLILECVHPSPLSANRGRWFGNNHFKLANEYLIKNKVRPIDWIKK